MDLLRHGIALLPAELTQAITPYAAMRPIWRIMRNSTPSTRKVFCAAVDAPG
jgi:hypothetical protein